MNGTTRLIAIVIVNFIMVAAMFYWLTISGIDIENTTLLDNAGNLGFTFDFLSFIVASFVVNMAILSFPSKKRTVLYKVLEIAAKKPARHSHKSHKNQMA